jgi:hypothetical protein
MFRWIVGLAVLCGMGALAAPARASVDSASASPATAQANKPPKPHVLQFDAVTVAAWKFLLKAPVVAPLKLTPPPQRIPGFQLKRTKAPPDLSIPY